MAEKKTIIINGNPVEVWQFSHSAQDIDDAVDAAVTQEERDAWDGKLDKSGGTMTGAVTFPAGENPALMFNGPAATLAKVSADEDNSIIFRSSVLSDGKAALMLIIRKNGVSKTHYLYGTHNEPPAQPGGGVPAGCIVLWSGAASDIPDGWHLCDGTNGTPDLRDRFVVGAGDAYTPGATGGNAQVTLTKEQIPAHTHTYSKASGSTSSYGMSNGGTSVIKSVSSTSTDSGYAGSGSPVDILPPYYALCYIMRIS